VSATETSVAKHWIDGQWTDSEEHGESVNPATGENIGEYAMAGLKEAQAASRVRGPASVSCRSK